MLQLSMAVILIAVAVMVEFVGMHPTGIYSYRHKGYKDFQIGLSKSSVLKQINLQKTMRQIKTCGPDGMIAKTSRKKLKMVEQLSASDRWISFDRTGKEFLFIFKEDKLVRVFIQRLRFGNKQGSVLFSDCTVVKTSDLDEYLETTETLPVYPEKIK